jgi:hypothetical protein
VDADTSAVVFQGSNTAGSGSGLTLEEVEEWLEREPAQADEPETDAPISPDPRPTSG